MTTPTQNHAAASEREQAIENAWNVIGSELLSMRHDFGLPDTYPKLKTALDCIAGALRTAESPRADGAMLLRQLRDSLDLLSVRHDAGMWPHELQRLVDEPLEYVRRKIDELLASAQPAPANADKGEATVVETHKLLDSLGCPGIGGLPERVRAALAERDKEIAKLRGGALRSRRATYGELVDRLRIWRDERRGQATACGLGHALHMVQMECVAMDTDPLMPKEGSLASLEQRVAALEAKVQP